MKSVFPFQNKLFQIKLKQWQTVLRKILQGLSTEGEVEVASSEKAVEESDIEKVKNLKIMKAMTHLSKPL